jgi:hypothetical protein
VIFPHPPPTPLPHHHSSLTLSHSPLSSLLCCGRGLDLHLRRLLQREEHLQEERGEDPLRHVDAQSSRHLAFKRSCRRWHLSTRHLPSCLAKGSSYPPFPSLLWSLFVLSDIFSFFVHLSCLTKALLPLLVVVPP